MTEIVKTLARSQFSPQKHGLCSKRLFLPEIANDPNTLGFVITRMPKNALQDAAIQVTSSVELIDFQCLSFPY